MSALTAAGWVILNSEVFFSNKRVVVVLALTASLLWGSAFPSIKTGYELFNIASGDISSKLVFAGYRFALAGLLLLVFASATGKKIFRLRLAEYRRLALLGFFMTTLQYVFFYIGLGNTTGVKGAIVNSTVTFFSVIFAHFVYKNDRLNMSTVLACIMGFSGVIVVSAGNKAVIDFSFSWNGEGFLILAAMFLAGAGIYGKMISQYIDVTIMTGWQLFIGGTLLTGIGILTGGNLSGFTIQSTALLIYMALLSSAAFTIHSTLMKYNPVSKITIFSFTTPIFGAVLSSLFLGERILELKNLLALLLVCSGILIVTVRSVKKH